MIEDFVRRAAVAMLMNTIRLFALNEITKSNQVSSGDTDEIADVESLAHQRVPSDNYNPPSAPMTTLFEKAPNEFVSKLRDDFRMQYGVVSKLFIFCSFFTLPLMLSFRVFCFRHS